MTKRKKIIKKEGDMVTDPKPVEELASTPPAPKPKKMEVNPEYAASRQRAHEAKVAKFLAGGEF